MSDVKDIAGVKANLEQIAADIDNGVPHAANICAWLTEIQADLDKRVGGSSMGEAASLKVRITSVWTMVEEFRTRLPHLATGVRALVAKQ